MNLQFEQKRVTVMSARGGTEAACVYEFALVGAGADGVSYISLTTGLDVTFLKARLFTDDSLLVLYHTNNPVDPQLCVAEFHFDNRTISHLQDHGNEWFKAHEDFGDRAPGEMTATPPERDDRLIPADGHDDDTEPLYDCPACSDRLSVHCIAVGREKGFRCDGCNAVWTLPEFKTAKLGPLHA